MVIGFEHLTANLSLEEEFLALILAKKLAKRKGPERAMNNRDLRDFLMQKGHYASPIRVRKMINHIRINCIVSNLVASSQGYYVAKNREDVERYVTSLRQRASAILAVAQSYY